MGCCTTHWMALLTLLLEEQSRADQIRSQSNRRGQIRAEQSRSEKNRRAQSRAK